MSKHGTPSVREWTPGHKTARGVQITLGLVIATVLVSFVKRLVLDVPHLAAGTVPRTPSTVVT